MPDKDLPSPDHRTPPGVTDATVEALGRLSEALETCERARGHLYSFHQLTGTSDFTLIRLLDRNKQPTGVIAPIGGNGLFIANLEYRFPIFSTVGGALFQRRHNQRDNRYGGDKNSHYRPKSGQGRIALTPTPDPFDGADPPGLDRPIVQPIFEIVSHFSCGTVAARGLFLQALEADSFQVLAQPGIYLAGRHRFALQHLQ